MSNISKRIDKAEERRKKQQPKMIHNETNIHKRETLNQEVGQREDEGEGEKKGEKITMRQQKQR